MNGDHFDRDADARVRAASFAWLEDQVDRHGDVLPWKVLQNGFILDGTQIHLLSMQGIFKPSCLDLPISIRTSAKGPYDDAFSADGLLRYRYQGDDPSHRDNVGLREAMRLQLPLVYFHGTVPGRYLTIWPVFVVGDDPQSLTFTIAGDDQGHLGLAPSSWEGAEGTAARREYVTTTVKRRVHQRTFRDRVLKAYSEQCSFCRFRHTELLDAAHIIPDSDLDGEPIVQNGLSLCRIHHGAYDRGFLGVTPDYRIEARADLLEEEDGPTLKHGIQGLHGAKLVVPRKVELRPDPERLEVRYSEFVRGGM